MASSRRTGTNENVSTYGGSGLGRDYTSLGTWETATTYDLVTAQVSEVLECYDDEVFDDFVLIQGATQSLTYFRIVRPAGTKDQPDWEGHDGTPNTGVRFITTSLENVFGIDNEGSSVQDIVAGHNINSSLSFSCFKIDDGYSGQSCIGCIALGDGNAGSGSIICFESQVDSGEVGYLINCITIRCSDVAFDHDKTGILYCYNCTCIDAAANGFEEKDGQMILKNCLCENSGGTDFVGIASADMTNCASSDGSAAGTGARINQTFTFKNAGNDDYHLDCADAGAKGFGTNLSADGVYAFDDDIDWVTRPATWDIGFDQLLTGPVNIGKIDTVLKASIGKIDSVCLATTTKINKVA
jgi:hypothetical protein